MNKTSFIGLEDEEYLYELYLISKDDFDDWKSKIAKMNEKNEAKRLETLSKTKEYPSYLSSLNRLIFNQMLHSLPKVILFYFILF
jgi:hypothetical protein